MPPSSTAGGSPRTATGTASRPSTRNLARLGFRDALHPEAVRLRVRWRIEKGSPAQAAAALPILDPILPLGLQGDFVLRARAAVAAGQSGQLRASLSALVLRLRPGPDSRRAARDVLSLLDAQPAGGAPGMGGLRARFERAAGPPGR